MSAFTVSRCRNRVIVRVQRELNLFEEWGTGYRRVVEDCQAGGYPVPEWEEYGPAVRVVFRPHPEVAAADETVNVPVNDTVNDTVNEMKARQLIEFTDAPKKGHYRIINQP